MVMRVAAEQGFFLTRQGLYSDQGDVLVSTDEGVVYTLRYGGPVFAEGDELTVGQPDDAEKKKDEPAKKDAAKKASEHQENRYLMVTVSFDPTLIAKPESMEPKPVAKPDGAGRTFPTSVFAPDPKDPKYHRRTEGGRREKADREKADYEKKIADGQKKVEELDRPVRPLVLRHARRQLPLDQPGPGRALSSPRSRRAHPAR